MIAVNALPPKSYYDESVYTSEQARIFHQHWLFVGFKDQLSEHNDFITLNAGGIPIVVQNFQGELSALLNICSHRKATLQTAKRGNRALVCPYHCWSFKQDGSIAGIPDRKSFELSSDEKKRLGLQSFNIETCGDFVFVRVQHYGPDLKSFLGPYYNILESLSQNFSQPVHSGVYDWQTNWKLAVETVLEVYHVPGVHPDSFSNLAHPECNVTDHPPHTTGDTPLQEAPKKWWKGVRKLLHLKQSDQFQEYNHFHIYPNLAIGITNGSLMSVQTYDPISSTECALNFQLRMATAINDKPVSEPAREAALKNFTEFNHTTLEEDRQIAESCQNNMKVSDKPGLLGQCEERIQHFHQAWRKDMEPNLEHNIQLSAFY